MKPWQVPRILGSVVFFLLVAALGLEARQITDIFGRQVVVQGRIDRVFSTSPPVTYMLYAIDRAVLVGLNDRLTEEQKQFLHPDVHGLPVVGGWFGQGKAPNVEVLLSVRPDLVVTSYSSEVMQSKAEQMARALRTPVVALTVDHLSQYPEAFMTLGRLLDREARGNQLAAYCIRALTETRTIVGAVPPDKRARVYYAEGPDGLSTECDQSSRTELIVAAGGKNVHRCQVREGYGMERISLEQVLLYDPEVILAFDKGFYSRIFEDRRWQSVSAVRSRKVYLIPDKPFNWFDRPPSFMRFIGLKWLTSILYPAQYPIDVANETRRFYKLFLAKDLTERELRRILHP